MNPVRSWRRLFRDVFLPAFAVLLVFASPLSAQRRMEKLDRGVVAVRASSTSAFVSWRLLGLDPAGVGFNLYRSANGGTAVKLNSSPLTGGTNFTDTTPNLTVSNRYFVRPVINGTEQAASGSFTLSANHAVEPIVRIPLRTPTNGYYTKFVWVGDLDGDGEYDFVIDRLAPFDPNNNDIGLGNQQLEAYKRDGTRLWVIDMGPSSRNTYNIEPGPTTISMGMYDGVTVYDLDGDGKAEVILKVADGVTFADGTKFANPTPARQFLAIIDGQTGTLRAAKSFPQDFAAAGSLGTQLGIGYLDGINPSVIGWLRNRNDDKSFNDIIVAWSWRGGNIGEQWKYLIPSGAHGIEASHQMRIVDVDGDGKDEFCTGNYCLNSNGTLRYVIAGAVHGDRLQIAKLDPTRPGLQGFYVQQNNPSMLYELYYDANTGAVQWNHFGTTVADIGRGMAADISPNGLTGYEVWSFSGVYTARNNTKIADEPNRPYPSQTFWWDDDLGRENLNDSKFEKWDYNTQTVGRLLTISNYGAVVAGHNPMFMGDIMGDWREEAVYLNSSYNELIIFTTPIATNTRIYTLPHNPYYRNCLTTKGYYQNPYVDYFLGYKMSPPPVPNITY